VKNGKTYTNSLALFKRFHIVLLLASLCFVGLGQNPNLFSTRNGNAYFLSDAPLEMISATSGSIIGVLNIEDRRFSFSIPVNTFEGFNSALQQTHFNEDYLETDIYPQATFKGKIIEEVDLGTTGQYRIRAKGKLNIHGLDNDRIIRCDVSVEAERIIVKAKFTVFLDNHDIKIPSIVNQKITEEIQVEIDLVMQTSN